MKRQLKIQEAEEIIFGTEIHKQLANVLSPPELLKRAAIECFLHTYDEEIESIIRASLIYLNETGLMPKENERTPRTE